MTYTKIQTQFLETAVKVHGEGAVLPKAVLAEVAKEAGTGFPYWMTNPKLDKCTKVSKGMYKIPSLSGEAIFDPVNDTEETAWNENYPAEAYHIEFLKERIERLEMENDALLAEIIS